jgi:hypothetical protein
VVGCSALACQMCIPPTVLVLGGGLAGSRTSLLVETPFLIRFRRLEGMALLASRFDMKEKWKRCGLRQRNMPQKPAFEAEPGIEHL